MIEKNSDTVIAASGHNSLRLGYQIFALKQKNFTCLALVHKLKD
jgi:hypothetical protein